jgi:hypothetical protein
MFSSRRQQNRVMRKLRTGEATPAKRVALAKVVYTGLFAKLPELDGELRKALESEAGDEFDAAMSIAAENLRGTPLVTVRRNGATLAADLARAFMETGVFDLPQSLVLASKTLQAANTADRRQILRLVHAKAKNRTWATPGQESGYRDALEMVAYNARHGKSLDFGIQAHGMYRQIGDTFTDEHGDEAGFHAGAEQAYQDIRSAYKEAA